MPHNEMEKSSIRFRSRLALVIKDKKVKKLSMRVHKCPKTVWQQTNNNVADLRAKSTPKLRKEYFYQWKEWTFKSFWLLVNSKLVESKLGQILFEKYRTAKNTFVSDAWLLNIWTKILLIVQFRVFQTSDTITRYCDSKILECVNKFPFY